MSDNVFHDLFARYNTFKHTRQISDDLLIADENISENELLLAQNYQLSVLTNRKDIALQCQTLEIDHYFSDFNIEQTGKRFDCIIYRVSKERPVCHYIFNQLKNHLKDDGSLIIGGKKTEGIKGYYQKLVDDLEFTGTLKKQKDRYIANLIKISTPTVTQELDDKNYRNLTKVEATFETRHAGPGSAKLESALSFYSKPGVYGWNKIDKGSQLLFDVFLRDIQHTQVAPTTLLDLGCGYGYLSIKVLEAVRNKTLDRLSQLYATDNNAGAIACSQKNLQDACKDLNISINISADDCGVSLQRNFDTILSNPPFHQGFEHAKSLTDKFLNNTAKLLASKGTAYFVVNAFIGIEKYADKYFDTICVLENTGTFKVVKLSKKNS